MEGFYELPYAETIRGRLTSETQPRSEYDLCVESVNIPCYLVMGISEVQDVEGMCGNSQEIANAMHVQIRESWAKYISLDLFCA